MQTALVSASSRRIFWGVVTLVSLIAIWWITKLIPHTIAIFTIAAFIAFGVRPMVTLLVRARVPKWLAIALIFVVLVLIVVLLLLVVVPMAIVQSQLLISNTPSYAHAVHTWVVDGRDALQARFPALQIPTIDIAQIGADRLGTLATETLASIGTIVINTATWLFIAFAAIGSALSRK